VGCKLRTAVPAPSPRPLVLATSDCTFRHVVTSEIAYRQALIEKAKLDYSRVANLKEILQFITMIGHYGFAMI